MTRLTIRINSHTAAMCESQHVVLCDVHYREVLHDGDILEVGDFPVEEDCDMCKMDQKIKNGENR